MMSLGTCTHIHGTAKVKAQCPCSAFREGTSDNICEDCGHPKNEHNGKIKQADKLPKPPSIRDALEKKLTDQKYASQLAPLNLARKTNIEANKGLLSRSATQSSSRKSSNSKSKKSGKTAIDTVTIAGVVLKVEGTERLNSGVMVLKNEIAPTIESLAMYHDIGLAHFSPSGVKFDRNMTHTELWQYLACVIPLLATTGLNGDTLAWTSCNPGAGHGPKHLTFAVEQDPSARTLWGKRLNVRRNAREAILVIATLDTIPPEDIYAYSSLSNWEDFAQKYNQLMAQLKRPAEDYISLDPEEDDDNSCVDDDMESSPPQPIGRRLQKSNSNRDKGKKPCKKRKRSLSQDFSELEDNDGDAFESPSLNREATTRSESRLKPKAGHARIHKSPRPEGSETDRASASQPVDGPTEVVTIEDTDDDDIDIEEDKLSPTGPVNYWDPKRILEFKL